MLLPANSDGKQLAQERWADDGLTNISTCNRGGFHILNLHEPVIRAELSYLGPKEFLQAKNASPKDFFDDSLVDNLERTGFFHCIGFDERFISIFEKNATSHRELINRRWLVSKLLDL